MLAVEVSEPGPAHVLRLVERPDPVPGPGEVLVAVRAATVNPTDLAARQGKVRGDASPPYVPGWDFSGEVQALGDGVTSPTVGDRVVGMIPWYEISGAVGAYASLVPVRVEWTVPLPDGLDPVVAATVPLNGLTAAQALARLAVAPGTRVLVSGASGSVGSFFVQLAASAGAEVTAWCSAGDEDWARSCGAAHVVSGREPAVAGPRFTAAFDAVPVGAALLPWLEDGARVVTTRRVDVDPHRGISAEVMLVRPDRAALAELVGQVASGALSSRVAVTMPLSDAADAHRRVEAGRLRGKIVLVPDDPGRPPAG